MYNLVFLSSYELINFIIKIISNANKVLKISDNQQRRRQRAEIKHPIFNKFSTCGGESESNQIMDLYCK